MTDEEKERVRFWRCEGLGYGTIAARLGLSENTVKSFCRRNQLTGVAAQKPILLCRHCGGTLPPQEMGRKRKFCCEACRRAWWQAHPELSRKTAFHSMTCAHCKKAFLGYGKQRRKYCSHACYLAARFGKGGCHDEGAV